MREQIRNEQLTAVMTKLEGESGFLCSQNDTMVKKQEKLQVACGLLPRLCHAVWLHRHTQCVTYGIASFASDKMCTCLYCSLLGERLCSTKTPQATSDYRGSCGDASRHTLCFSSV